MGRLDRCLGQGLCCTLPTCCEALQGKGLSQESGGVGEGNFDWLG